MNILFLALDINLGNRTGDSIHVRELALSLTKAGNKVFLVAAQPSGGKDLNWAQGIPNLQLFLAGNRRDFGSLSTLNYCRKIGKEHNANVIYERRNSPKIGYAASKILKIPLFVEINAIVEEEKVLMSGEKRDEVSLVNFRKKMRARFYRHAERMVAVTAGIKMHIHTTYNVPEERIVVVPNGANTSLFRPLDKEQCIRELNLDKGKQNICFVGNLAPWQGLNHMIDAMPMILKARPNTVFLIVGGGREKEALENRAGEMNLESDVIFTGGVDYEQVPVYINASDVCVAPLASGREKSGSSAIKIFEYLACEKPVVATDLSGLEFLTDAQCGIVVPKGDASLLANSVLKLLSDDEKRMNMGKNGRIIVVDNYSWDSTARRITDLLENIAKVCVNH